MSPRPSCQGRSTDLPWWPVAWSLQDTSIQVCRHMSNPCSHDKSPRPDRARSGGIDHHIERDAWDQPGDQHGELAPAPRIPTSQVQGFFPLVSRPAVARTATRCSNTMQSPPWCCFRTTVCPRPSQRAAHWPGRAPRKVPAAQVPEAPQGGTNDRRPSAETQQVVLHLLDLRLRQQIQGPLIRVVRGWGDVDAGKRRPVPAGDRALATGETPWTRLARSGNDHSASQQAVFVGRDGEHFCSLIRFRAGTVTSLVGFGGAGQSQRKRGDRKPLTVDTTTVRPSIIRTPS